jgi:hypothetical protein
MPVVDGRVCALPVQRASPSASEAAPSARRTDLSRFAIGVRAECGPVSVDHGRTSAAEIPHRRNPAHAGSGSGSEPIDPTHDLGEEGLGREGMQFPERCDQAGDARLDRFIEDR